MGSRAWGYPITRMLQLCHLSPAHGGGKVAQRRACLPSASAPYVPICAAVSNTPVVVLAWRSAPGGPAMTVDRGWADGTCLNCQFVLHRSQQRQGCCELVGV